MTDKPIANPNLPAPPKGKYPAKDHCRRVAKQIVENGGPNGGVIYLEGMKEVMKEDDDVAQSFRQRRPFFYLTGCELPDCFFAYDIANDHSTLWIPPIDPEYVMWAGMPLQPKEALERYDVDEVLTTDELKAGDALLKMLQTQSQTTVFAIPDRSDMALFHTAAFQTHQPTLNYTRLDAAITTCRVVKDAHEIALLRHANAVSSYAHQQVLAAVPRAKNERELNALFVMHCHANGCKDQAYGCVCAAGTAASTLHYVHNDQPLTDDKLNLLLDAGAEWSCYCADITRTFPLTKDGRFTKESREVYDLVLRMQSECMAMIKAGVLWEDVHMRAHAVAAEGLRDLGILNKDLSVEEILKTKVTCRFFPHGLGHYIGMACHDVGGNADYADPDEYFRYLRIRGRLPANSVVTNEPGIYFREFPFRAELEAGKWEGVVERGVLEGYWKVGGVRIEDDIWVKEEGCENLTTVGSAWEEVEGAVRGKVG